MIEKLLIELFIISAISFIVSLIALYIIHNKQWTTKNNYIGNSKT